MGHIQTIDELIDFLLRRLWLILAIGLIGGVFAAIYAKTRPAVYESSAVLQIENPVIDPLNANGSGAGASPDDTLREVQSNLNSRENMLAVIERHQLFGGAGGLSPDQKIVLLRQSVRFETINGGAMAANGQRAASAMIITATMGDADLAARVANDFAQSMLDESNSSQIARRQETMAFYQEEAARLEREIEAVDAETATYRGEHSDSMPAVRVARQAEITGFDSDLRTLERELAGLNGQKALLERGGTTRATERRQLEELNAQISVAEAQRQQIVQRRAAIEASLTDVAEVDRIIAGYERRTEQLQAQYDVIGRRLAEAETAARLDDRHQSGRITLLERARTPEYPLAGGAKKIAIAGVLASLVAGVGLAFVLDMLKPVVRTADQMARELDLRPVVSIPDLAPKKTRLPGVGGLKRLLDDPRKPLMGLPRYAVFIGGAAVFAFLAAVVA